MGNIRNLLKPIIKLVTCWLWLQYLFPEVTSALHKTKPQSDRIDWLGVRSVFNFFEFAWVFNDDHDLWSWLDERPVLTSLLLVLISFIRLQIFAWMIHSFAQATRTVRKTVYSLSKILVQYHPPQLDPKLTRKTSGPHPRDLTPTKCQLCRTEIGQFQISVEHLNCGNFFHKRCLLDRLTQAERDCPDCLEPLTSDPQRVHIGPLVYRVHNLNQANEKVTRTLAVCIVLRTFLWVSSSLLNRTLGSITPVGQFIDELIIFWAMMEIELKTHAFIAGIRTTLAAIGISLHPLVTPLLYPLLRYGLRWSNTLLFATWGAFHSSRPLWLRTLSERGTGAWYECYVVLQAFDLLIEADAVRGAEHLVPAWLKEIYRTGCRLIVSI